MGECTQECVLLLQHNDPSVQFGHRTLEKRVFLFVVLAVWLKTQVKKIKQ